MFNEIEVLRIGAPAALEAGPLLRGLSEAPNVVLETGSWASLRAGFAADAYDAVLMPPWEAFQYPGLRMIPGIGVIARPGSRIGLISARIPLEQVRCISAAPGAEGLLGIAQGLIQARFQVCVEGADGCGETDAWITHGGEAIPEAGRYPHVTEMGGLWHALTDLPWVMWVWLCRFRAPYSALRRQLTLSRQSGLSELAALGEAGDYDYSLGSREAEGLRFMRGVAEGQGRCSADGGIQFC